MAITQYFTGLSDDSFFGREGEFLDCNNIDIIENSRYIDGAKQPSLTEIGTSIGSSITVCKDSVTYPVFANATGTYWGFGGVNGSVSDGGMSGAYLIEQIGTSTLPVTYWFKNGYIRQQTYNGSSVTNVGAGAITTNVPSGVPTASCVGAGRIYFAVGNIIYVINTTVDPATTLSTVNATPANSTIPYGYTIKYIYIYMDVMNVVTTNGKDTTIYQLVESTTDVWVIRYYHTKQGVVCINAYGDGNNIYWISSDSIYLSNGTDSQKVKVYGKDEFATTFSASSFCTISDGIFKISDGADLFEYGHKKPGYGLVLIKKTRPRALTAMSGRLEVSYNNPNVYGARDNSFPTSPYKDWSWTSLPYEGSVFAQKMEQLALRVGLMLPAYSTYTSTSTLCSMTVQVLTDEMDALAITTPVTVATITTPATGVAERFVDISLSEINAALSNAGYNPDFHYLKVTINGLKGDLASTTAVYGENLGRKTPKLFSVEFIHKDIKKGIPQ